MNLRKLWPTAILALLFNQDALAAVIDSEVWSVNGHGYYLLAPATWADSEAEAVALGGHLATINDQAEQDWIWTRFASLIPTNPPLLGDAGLWIGYTESTVFGASLGNWIWISGEQSSYTNWYAGEPNAANEDFAFMWVVNSGKWLDADNAGSGNRVYGVAEVQRSVISLPAPLWLLGAGFLSYLGLGYSRRRQS